MYSVCGTVELEGGGGQGMCHTHTIHREWGEGVRGDQMLLLTHTS